MAFQVSLGIGYGVGFLGKFSEEDVNIRRLKFDLQVQRENTRWSVTRVLAEKAFRDIAVHRCVRIYPQVQDLGEMLVRSV